MSINEAPPKPSSGTRRALWIVGAVGGGAVACLAQLTSPPSAALDCAPGTCVVDPVARCLGFGDYCGPGVVCPNGSVCSIQLEPAVCLDASPDAPAASRCSADDATGLNTSVLTTGFMVQSFGLQRVLRDAGPAAFAWGPVANASTVQCALFACQPFVQATGMGNVDHPSYGIVNYTKCALEEQLFTSNSGTFDLAELTVANGVVPGALALDASCRRVSPTTPVTVLSVGCWAYDSTQVIAASPLVAIGANDVATALVDPTCSSGTGASCLLGASGRFGTCVAGTCMQRCMDDFDCRTDHGSDAAPLPISAIESIDAGADAGPAVKTICFPPPGQCQRSAAEVDAGAMGVCGFPGVADGGRVRDSGGSEGGPDAGEGDASPDADDAAQSPTTDGPDE